MYGQHKSHLLLLLVPTREDLFMEENQRVRLSKRLLGNALIDLLAEKSIHKISVREICERAQINRTTFYKYYGSQYDLLSALENEIIKRIESRLSNLDDTMFNVDVLNEIIAFLDSNSDLLKLLLNNNVDPDFPANLINLPCIRQMLTANLRSVYGQDERDYAFSFVVYGCVSVIQKWLNKEQQESPDEIAALLGGLIQKTTMPP